MKKNILYIILTILFISISFSFLSSSFSKRNGNIIKFSSWGSQSETKILNSVIKEFEKENPEIKIKFLHFPQNYFQKIHILFASDLAPDVIFINNQNIQLYIQAGLLENLESEFPNADKIFYKTALDCFKKNNQLYAIPRDISNLVIYYNKDIFKKLGIKIPEKINNLDELKTLTEKLTTKENFGINFEEDSLFWSYYLAANGGGIISDDKKSIIIGSKQSIDALNLYSDFVNKYHIAPSKSQIGSMTTAQMFINGKLAMYLGGRWMVPKFRETIKFDWDVIEFPSNNENKLYIDASGWAVSKKSKNKEIAIQFIKYLSSKKNIDKFTEIGLIIPARKDSAEGKYFLDNKNPKNAKAFLEMLKYSKPTPATENYNYINDILKEKTQSIFLGEKRAEKVFDYKTINKLESKL